MATGSGSVYYCEEDGFEITQDNKILFVYGQAEAEYGWYSERGTQWDPPAYEVEREGSMDLDISEITDEDGNPVSVELTPENRERWEDYMSDQLDSAANSWDFSD